MNFHTFSENGPVYVEATTSYLDLVHASRELRMILASQIHTSAIEKCLFPTITQTTDDLRYCICNCRTCRKKKNNTAVSSQMDLTAPVLKSCPQFLQSVVKLRYQMHSPKPVDAVKSKVVETLVCDVCS